jgi:hypothetical protein
MAKRISFRLTSEGVDELRRDLEALGPAGAQAFARIEDSAPQLANALRRSERDAESLGRQLRTTSDRGGRGLVALTRAGEGARDGLEDLAVQGGALGMALRGLGPAGLVAAAGLGGAVLAARELSQATQQALADVADLGREASIAGVGVEAYQELSYAAQRYGVTTGALTDALKELSMRADEFADTGAGPAADAFKDLDYSAAELNQMLGDTPALLEDVIARMGEMDAASRLRLADELFGGEGGEQFAALVNAGAAALRELRQEARELGLVYEADLVEQARESNRQLRLMQQIAEVELNKALVSLGPVLVDLARWFAEATAAGARLLDVWREIGDRQTVTLQMQLADDQASLAALKETAPQIVDNRAGKTRAREIRQKEAEINAIQDELIQRRARWLSLEAEAAATREAVAAARQQAQAETEIAALIESQADPVARANALLAERRALIASTYEAGTADYIEAMAAAEREHAAALDSSTSSAGAKTDALKRWLDTSGQAVAVQARYTQALVDERLSLEEAALAREVYTAQLEAGVAPGSAEADLVRMRVEMIGREREAAANREAALRAGAALHEQMRTPLEAYNNEVARLNELLAVGAISQETYGRAAEAANETLRDASPILREVGRVGESTFDAVGGAIMDMTRVGEDGFTSLWDVATAALTDINNMMLQMSMINPLKNAVLGTDLPTGGDLFGGLFDDLFGPSQTGYGSTGNMNWGGSSLSVPAPVLHDGGIVGSSAAPQRWVDSDIFIGAPRYHTGGIVGLAPNERPIIAEVGERITPAGQPMAITVPPPVVEVHVHGDGERQPRVERRGNRIDVFMDEQVAGALAAGPRTRATMRQAYGVAPGTTR